MTLRSKLDTVPVLRAVSWTKVRQDFAVHGLTGIIQSIDPVARSRGIRPGVEREPSREFFDATGRPLIIHLQPILFDPIEPFDSNRMASRPQINRPGFFNHRMDSVIVHDRSFGPELEPRSVG